MNSINDLLNQHTHIAKLGKRVAGHKALCQQVRACLPHPLDQQVKATVFQSGTLTLFADSPVWASRLRYASPQLASALANHLLNIHQIRVRILAHSQHTQIPKLKLRKSRLMSNESSKTLRLTAETITDPSLKEALLRLSRHIQKS
jgi:hypothetical protein